MIGNALLAASAILLALIFWLMEECTFLVPFRDVLYRRYGGTIGLCAIVLFANIFAACHAAARLLFLKDTGRKLAHLERQIRSGASISEELTERLEREGGR
jgi:hypothetical protein